MKPLFISICVLMGLSLRQSVAEEWVKTSAVSNGWSSIAVSADGRRVVAAAGDSFNSPLAGIYVSTNSGDTWSLTSAPSNAWKAVACSADGLRIVAASSRSTTGRGPIYTSGDGGGTWVSNNVAEAWWSIACSADGMRIYGETVFGLLYSSTNGGANWKSEPAPGGSWAITCSPDGNTVLAAGGNSAPRGIVISRDNGATWSTNRVPFGPWAVAMSADGATMMVGDGGSLPTASFISRSVDSGLTWTSNNSPPGLWQSISSSADGQRIIASARRHSADPTGPVYSSTNFGSSWFSNTLEQLSWRAVACSADGGVSFAVHDRALISSVNFADGNIWRSQTPIQPRLNIIQNTNLIKVSWVIPSSPLALEVASDLSAPEWKTVTNTSSLNLSNLQMEVVFSPGSGSRFFRLAPR